MAVMTLTLRIHREEKHELARICEGAVWSRCPRGVFKLFGPDGFRLAKCGCCGRAMPYHRLQASSPRKLIHMLCAPYPAQEGETAQLRGARVITTLIVNGEPQTAIEIIEGVRTLRFGEGLQLSEQQWLVCEINQQLEAMRGEPVDYAAFPMEEMPETIRDDATRTDTDIP